MLRSYTSMSLSESNFDMPGARSKNCISCRPGQSGLREYWYKNEFSKGWKKLDFIFDSCAGSQEAFSTKHLKHLKRKRNTLPKNYTIRRSKSPYSAYQSTKLMHIVELQHRQQLTKLDVLGKESSIKQLIHSRLASKSNNFLPSSAFWSSVLLPFHLTVPTLLQLLYFTSVCCIILLTEFNPS